MGEDDPYLIAASNERRKADRRGLPITIEIPLPGDDEEEDKEADEEPDDAPDGEADGDGDTAPKRPASGGAPSQAAWFAVLFALAAALVVLVAVALGLRDADAVACRDLPDWNRDADCI